MGDGTNYNYFRDYDPAIGRYVESDPIGLEGGLNTFAYAKADPLRFIDPRGESIGAAAAVIGVVYACGTIPCEMRGIKGCKTLYPNHADPLSKDHAALWKCIHAVTATCLTFGFWGSDPIGSAAVEVGSQAGARSGK